MKTTSLPFEYGFKKWHKFDYVSYNEKMLFYKYYKDVYYLLFTTPPVKCHASDDDKVYYEADNFEWSLKAKKDDEVIFDYDFVDTESLRKFLNKSFRNERIKKLKNMLNDE